MGLVIKNLGILVSDSWVLFSESDDDDHDVKNDG